MSTEWSVRRAGSRDLRKAKTHDDDRLSGSDFCAAAFLDVEVRRVELLRATDEADAAAAVGEAVGEPKIVDPGPSAMPGVTVKNCEYKSATGNSIQLTVWRPFGDSAAMFMQIYKSECMKKEQVAGLGDVACWNSKEHRELQVLKGATILTFEINRNGNATEVLKTVAKTALTRLGNP